MLSSEPNQLPGFLLCRQWSYFFIVLARLGHVLVLDGAFRCLVTVAHSVLVPTHEAEAQVIHSRSGRTLHSLQFAVNHHRARYSTEALCAISILALFEVISDGIAEL